MMNCRRLIVSALRIELASIDTDRLDRGMWEQTEWSKTGRKEGKKG